MAEVGVEQAKDFAGAELKIKHSPSAHLAFVDSLRGLAIFAVICHHAAPRIPGLNSNLLKLALQGSQGVQLFFVMSAFTLFLSMGSRRGNEKSPITAFYIRRFFRIAPLFYIGFVFYNFVYKFDSEAQGIEKSSWMCIFTTLTFTNGWHGSWINRMVPGGWSIAVEMSFYLIVPLLFCCIGTLRAAIFGTVIALIAAVGCKFALTKILPRIAGDGVHDLVNGLDYYWLPTQMPIFLLGITLYFILKPSISIPRERTFRRFTDGCVLLFISLYILVGTTFSDTNLYLGHMLTGIAFVLLAWSLFLFPNPFIVNRAVCYLGTISYSGYITHFAVLHLADGFLLSPGRAGSLVTKSPNLAFLVLLLITLAGTILVSSVTYRFIERPGIQAGRRLIRTINGHAE